MRRLGIAICSMCAGIFCCAVHAGSGTAGPAGDANFSIARLEQYLDGVSRVRTSGEAYSGVFFASDGESAAKLGLSKTTARPVDDVMRKWLDSHEVTASESEFSTISWGGLRRTEVSIYWRPDGDETREIIDFGVYLRSGAGLFEWHPVQRGERGVVTEVLSNPRMAIFVPPFNGPQAGALVNPVSWVETFMIGNRAANDDDARQPYGCLVAISFPVRGVVPRTPTAPARPI